MDIQLDIIIDFILCTAYQFMSFLSEEIVSAFLRHTSRTPGIYSIEQPLFHRCQCSPLYDMIRYRGAMDYPALGFKYLFRRIR